MRSYEVEIQRPAKKCFAAFCRVEDLPSWVPGLVAAEPLSKDRAGRPSEVRFVAQLAEGQAE